MAKDGKLSGEYFTKPSRGKLVQPGFPIYGIYTPVKDCALVSMIITYKMEGEKPNGLEKFSQTTKNGKVYASRNDFDLKWLLNCNESEENKWAAFSVGVDHFQKLK